LINTDLAVDLLSRRGWNPIKLAHELAGWLLTEPAIQPTRVRANWVSIFREWAPPQWT